jgi:hypothetical protein
MTTVKTVMTCVAWDMVGCSNTVTEPEFIHPITYFNNFSRHLMSKDQGDLIAPVPLHDITAANPACKNPHKELAFTYFRYRHFFDTDIIVTIVHQNPHGIVVPSPKS